MLNKEKGITLIALIITIIVMLILVGVTINVALNGGLFTKAEQATKETEEKAILEEMLAMMGITDNGKIDYSTIITEIGKKYEVESYNYPNATIKGKLGTYNYIVSENEIKIGTKEIKKFDWEDVGLTVDIDTDYKFYDTTDGTTYIIYFKADGNLIVKKDGTTLATYDAKDDSNINDDGYLTIKFTLNGTPYDTTLTMNINNIDVDAELKDFTTVTYTKEQSKTYPVAYGIFEGLVILETSPDEIIFWINYQQKANKYKIVPCTNILEIKSKENTVIVENKSNIAYSKVILDSEGFFYGAIYSEELGAWIITPGETKPNEGKEIWKINPDSAMLITTLTQEQINTIIQAANAITE